MTQRKFSELVKELSETMEHNDALGFAKEQYQRALEKCVHELHHAKWWQSKRSVYDKNFDTIKLWELVIKRIKLSAA